MNGANTRTTLGWTIWLGALLSLAMTGCEPGTSGMNQNSEAYEVQQGELSLSGPSLNAGAAVTTSTATTSTVNKVVTSTSTSLVKGLSSHPVQPLAKHPSRLPLTRYPFVVLDNGLTSSPPLGCKMQGGNMGNNSASAKKCAAYLKGTANGVCCCCKEQLRAQWWKMNFVGMTLSPSVVDMRTVHSH